MSAYAWCEDTGSGFEFWNEIFKTLHPEIVVETKTNNTRLRKAASKIEDDGNEYYILMDSFLDNIDVMRELDRLKKSVSGKDNVHVVDVKSFEFALLTFQSLVQWVFSENDALKDSREDLIRARQLFTELVAQSAEAEQFAEFQKLIPYAKVHNNEQTAAWLLYQLTRNTGFETTKGKLGDCFVTDCCAWASRQPNDVCGLDTARLEADEKKRKIVNRSVLKTAFEKVGL